MFEFLKPKPKTAIPTFAPLGIDIHCHMLPGVDDGSKSNEESLACLKVMRDAGFEKVICTPHYQYPRFPNVESDIQNRYDSMLLDFTSLNAQNIPQMIGVAGEYRVDSGFADRIKNNQFLLVGGKYLLTEFSLHQQVIGLDQVMFDLQMKNYEIILAHTTAVHRPSCSISKTWVYTSKSISFHSLVSTAKVRVAKLSR